jgi:uncharacterized Zn finger protein
VSIRVDPRLNYRSIIFLCMECQGDLEVVRESKLRDPHWRCVACGRVWVYRAAGWELVNHSASAPLLRCRDGQ